MLIVFFFFFLFCVPSIGPETQDLYGREQGMNCAEIPSKSCKSFALSCDEVGAAPVGGGLGTG